MFGIFENNTGSLQKILLLLTKYNNSIVSLSQRIQAKKVHTHRKYGSLINDFSFLPERKTCQRKTMQDYFPKHH